MIIDKETIKSVSELLKIAIEGNEQDWEIEFADKDRIIEFVDVLANAKLAFAEKYAIVSLILASYDDYISSQTDYNKQMWKKIVNILEQGGSKYDEVLNYWAVWGESQIGNFFPITPIIRKYLEER